MRGDLKKTLGVIRTLSIQQKGYFLQVDKLSTALKKQLFSASHISFLNNEISLQGRSWSQLLNSGWTHNLHEGDFDSVGGKRGS